MKVIRTGVEDYKKIKDNDYYYVDKTLLIRDLLDKGGEATLLTRPRRFGKTLALSMLKTFFEKELDAEGNTIDNSAYFAGMKIMDAGERYIRHMGQYPVIALSLKSAKQPNFDMAYSKLAETVSMEFKRHRYVLDSNVLLSDEYEKYEALMLQKGSMADYATSLLFLSHCLKKYHGKKVIVFIDEYDVPLENAYFRDFYDRMVDFIRSLLESVLKTNDSLEFAVITGCLRISRESIFTGLNNLKILSVMNQNCAEYFGFVQEEVDELLSYYGLTEKKEEIKWWYDGYLFGKTEVYNPWSVLGYVDDVLNNPDHFPKPYWANTSSNSIVKELIEYADPAARDEIEQLISGGTIEKPIHEDIVYNEIHKSQDNLWNFLYFTGYLKAVSQRFADETLYQTMALPNAEVRWIYRNTVREWFQERMQVTDLSTLYQAILEGNEEVFAEQVTDQLIETVSYYDYAENYYHGFLCGLLKGCKDYNIISNREQGEGRPDILMQYPSARGQAIIMEIKIAKEFSQMDAMCDEALMQIEERNYAAPLQQEGYSRIKKYGICFYKKNCKVKMQGEG